MLTLALLLLAAAQDPPAAHWTFDGDAKDSGPAALPTKVLGRLEYIDSPVGKSGRAAVLNAVDSYIEAGPSAAVGAGSADFSLSFWVLVLDKRPVTLFSRKGWAVALQDNGSLKFSVGQGFVTTNPAACPPGQWCHVAVVRSATGKIFINGELAGMGDLRAGTLDAPQGPLLMGKGAEEQRPFGGLIDDVRLYARALEPDEVTKLTDDGMPWLRVRNHVKKPFGGRFELKENDVVAFTGAEDARVGQELAYLETLLTQDSAGKSVRFRNMAWEGDTVTEQLRPLNFGSWTDQFRRAGVSVVFAQFGQIESLEGKDGVERFSAAYEALLAQFAKTTSRIVLVSPAPFVRMGPYGPHLGKRQDLPLYVDAIRTLADKHGYLFVDLSTPAMAGAGLSRDGLHLSDAGQWMAARETARQLEIPGVSDLDAPDAKGAFRRESLEKLRVAIRYKNVLWADSWRPTNWAFLNGDRMEQPSSRDHVDRRVRWFPVEIQQNAAMLRREEEKIGAQVEKK
jgi:hypothetical protein